MDCTKRNANGLNGKHEPNCIKTKNRPLCYCHQQLTKFDVIIVLKNGAATDTKQAKEMKLSAQIKAAKKLTQPITYAI